LRMWQSDSVRASIAVYLQQLSAERA
jgi:hypothetical protein